MLQIAASGVQEILHSNYTNKHLDQVNYSFNTIRLQTTTKNLELNYFDNTANLKRHFQLNLEVAYSNPIDVWYKHVSMYIRDANLICCKCELEKRGDLK